MEPILDRFIQIIDENSLNPEDIERVEYTPVAVSLNRMWEENELRTEEDFGFHGPYLIACAAYRIKSIDFVSQDVQEDTRIRDFMKKVKVLPVHKQFGKAILEDPGHMVRLVEVTVYAKNKVLKAENRVVEWTWNSNIKATDEDLVKKFKDLVSNFLPPNKIEKAAETILNLEAVEDVNNVTELLVP
jgi:2-methylcitrate dehydratase PrpD